MRQAEDDIPLCKGCQRRIADLDGGYCGWCLTLPLVELCIDCSEPVTVDGERRMFDWRMTGGVEYPEPRTIWGQCQRCERQEQEARREREMEKQL